MTVLAAGRKEACWETQNGNTTYSAETSQNLVFRAPCHLTITYLVIMTAFSCQNLVDTASTTFLGYKIVLATK